MRWFLTNLIWLFATTTLAFPTQKQSSWELGHDIKNISELGLGRYTDTFYTEKTVLPPLKRSSQSISSTDIQDGRFTRVGMDWLLQKSLADVNTPGLKETTAALGEFFSKHNIPWVISGGWALILHGEPTRKTPDIDIIVETTMPELKKLLAEDGRFLVPGDNWWPDDAHLQTFHKATFKNEQKYYDVDMIISGQKNSAKKVASITQSVPMTYEGKNLAIPVIGIKQLFISKVYGLASPKRQYKHGQDVQDISWLIENRINDLASMKQDLPLDKRQIVVRELNRYHSPSLAKARKLLGL
ncbi:hypothetical protein LX36DRAFT_728413 [Colletotrichum falcatum]|nr:hypothetical protein LX36DRAFT_728413 [Colletotrichum falcatum]